MWSPDPGCAGISRRPSVDVNERWMRLSKAFAASGMQAPLLPQGCKHGLGMSLAQGILKLRMTD